MTDLIKWTSDSENQIESSSSNPSASAPPTQQVQSTPEEAGREAGSSQSYISKKAQRPKSEKPDFQTIEQFIEYAYSKQGKPIALNKKDEGTIAVGPKLDNEAKARLFELAQKDTLLAVPKQLLLVTMKIDSSKTRGEIREFVGELLRRHKAFDSPPLIAALRNLSDAPSIEGAIELAASVKFPAGDVQQRPLKSGDLARLRSNAANTLAIWFALIRDASLAELSRGLFTALWHPQTRKTHSEYAQLRILSQISDLAGVGIACQSFKAEAEREAFFAQSAQREKERSLDQVAALERDAERLNQTIQEKDHAYEELTRTLGDQKTEYENAITLLRDELQHLRGRILRRLRSEVSLLDEALHALRKDPPKVDVMDDHAERVVEALRNEIKNLEEAE